MRNFDIGDIVKLKENEKILFMVVDYADFTQETASGKPIVDIDYELAQVFPIQKSSKYTVESQNDIMIHAQAYTRGHVEIMHFIKKCRDELGLLGVPDYIGIAESNLEAIANAEHREHTKQDVVRYNSITTINECLEAINDLNALHKMFGDEDYIKSKEVVTARIIKLQE